MSQCIGKFEEISRYIDGDLTSEEENALLEHMSSCERCQVDCSDILALRDALRDVPIPEDLHENLMSAVRERGYITRERKKRAIRWLRPVAAVAAITVVAFIGIAGMKMGYMSFDTATYTENNVEDAGGEAEMRSNGQLKVASLEEDRSDGASTDAAENAVGSSETGFSGDKIVYELDQMGIAWMNDGPVEMRIVEGVGSGIHTDNTGNQVDIAIQEEAGYLAGELGEKADGYGFCLVVCGGLDELPEEISSEAPSVEEDDVLLLYVNNSQKVRQEVYNSMTMSGFEAYDDEDGEYFDLDSEAEKGLVVVRVEQ